MKRLVLALCAIPLLSGCATVLDRSTQKVTFLTPGVENAECHAKNDKHHYIVMTPGSERVEKTRYDLTVTCSKEGYRDAVVTLPAKHAPRAGHNVWATLGLGYGYDQMSGAAYRYPDKIEITMDPVENVAAYEARKKWTWLEDWDSADRTVDEQNIPDLSSAYSATEETGFYDFTVTDDGAVEIFESGDMPPLELPDNMAPAELEPQAGETGDKGLFDFIKRPKFMESPKLDFLKKVRPSNVSEMNSD